MGKYIIEGGHPLTGTISISGSKNAALPILSACILCRDKCTIKNCPRIKDAENAVALLNKIGACTRWKGNTLFVDSSNIYNHDLTEGPADKFRGSIIFLGALLGAFGKAEISAPGGCRIGRRPIDYHIEGLSRMNAEFSMEQNTIRAYTEKLYGAEITLRTPSVGATENIMIASVLAKGETIIKNAAKEPEITDLQNFLNSMGAEISGAGSSKIISKGVSSLHGTEYRIIPDRIEAGTFLIAAAATKSEVFLKNAVYEHIRKVCGILEDSNCVILHDKSGIYVDARNIVLSPHIITTGAYPAFPTDLQPQMMSLLTTAPGTSIIIETVFESRFLHAEELKKLGADITFCNNRFTVNGVPKLCGGNVCATDLRCGAALITAALSAEGESAVDGSEFVERGYQNIDRKLRQAGASIRLIE